MSVIYTSSNYTYKWRRTGILQIALFIFSSYCYADYQRGKEYYDLGQYKEAWHELYGLAKQGNASAQIIIGHMYGAGDGVIRNLEKSVQWYKKAAQQGNARGQALTGFMYHSGRGVQKNHKKAFHWYIKASVNGDLYAQLELGKYYNRGLGVNSNAFLSYVWFTVAEMSGEICACLLDEKKLVEMKITKQDIEHAKELSKHIYYHFEHK
ncbi:MAG: sel1 repeat family protein [Sedimenticola sp.]|nr:sel1 repeat family protein [Sedimenticola sp.]